MKRKIFNLNHLKEENITYPRHFLRSLNIALMMFLGFLAGVAHALLPFVFYDYNTKNIKKMFNKIRK